MIRKQQVSGSGIRDLSGRADPKSSIETCSPCWFCQWDVGIFRVGGNLRSDVVGKEAAKAIEGRLESEVFSKEPNTRCSEY